MSHTEEIFLLVAVRIFLAATILANFKIKFIAVMWSHWWNQRNWLARRKGRRNQDNSHGLLKRINGAVRTLFRVPPANWITSHGPFLCQNLLLKTQILATVSYSSIWVTGPLTKRQENWTDSVTKIMWDRVVSLSKEKHMSLPNEAGKDIGWIKVIDAHHLYQNSL